MNKSKISFLKLPRVLSLWEKRLIIILSIVALVAVGFWLYQNYLNSTVEVPKNGGTYTEGVLGQPKFINPIIAQPNTVDMDLITLIYSPLFHYSPQNELVNDLAESYEISEDGLTVTVTLREGVVWQDGEPFKADDVVFTVESIQNPNLQSPLKSAFDNVTVEKGDDKTVIFHLEEPYAPFLSSLTFGILPKHLWEQVEPANIPLTELNLQPVGTGPYEFKEFKKDKLGEIKSYTLARNDSYFGDQPYIDDFVFKFYPTYDELVNALYLEEIDGLSFNSEIAEAIVSAEDLSEYEFQLPRYNAVFLNYEKKEDLEFKKVREAMDISIDLNELQNILPPGAELIAGPILENFIGFNPELVRPEYNFDQAHTLLHEAGWNEVDEEDFRTKDGERLAFTLLVSDFPEHQAIADFLVESWKKIGIDAQWESLSPADIQTRIRERDYEAILFGQVTGHDPDPFPFWHSSQRQDPGLNLTAAKDKDADTLLEEARISQDEADRAAKYKDFQARLLEDHVVIFLYTPAYHYAVSNKIRGIEPGVITNPAERFTDISKWYIETRRIRQD
ncbi:ABC transporter substrate-binding protein [Patescibacteria group bacterium]